MLDDRQRDAVNLLIDIQRIDVGHARDLVYDSHEARLEVIGIDVVL